MTSDKQIEANRTNALASTGPRTEEGKAIVAQNALKHGLTAQRVLLPDEDKDELIQFVERLRDHFQPVGEVEVLLVERVIAAAWRLRRVYRVEADVFSTRFYDVVADRAHKEAETCQRSTYDDLLESNRVVTDAARREQALAKADEARARRDAEETTLGAAVGAGLAQQDVHADEGHGGLRSESDDSCGSVCRADAPAVVAHAYAMPAASPRRRRYCRQEGGIRIALSCTRCC